MAGEVDVHAVMQFWLHQAHKNADARALADSLGLELPRGDPYGFKAGLKYPIRRLVLTGNDTPENFRILFGVDNVPRIHAETRKEVLMGFATQKGSPSDVMAGFLDEGCPAFSPRPANETEQEEIREQLEFNEIFATAMGGR